MSFTNENLFWCPFGKALKTELQNLFTSPDEIDLIPPIQDQEEFNYAFEKCGQLWQYLVKRQKEMKQPIYERPTFAIHALQTFMPLRLVPFMSSSPLLKLQSKLQTTNLYNEFMKDYELEIKEQTFWSHKPLWNLFNVETLGVEISKYCTFDRIINILKMPGAEKAMKLLCIYFLGSLNAEVIRDNENCKLAEFLVAEGVLMCVGDIEASQKFQINSTMDTLDVLLNVIPFFEKDIIGYASAHSFKKAPVPVGGYNGVNVPRESVYQTELDRILVKWLGTQRNFEVTGQWHLTQPQKKKNKGGKHQYCDIVIMGPDSSSQPIVILELLATGTQNNLDEHYE
ncbi:5744_t:CDS:2 [Entrophospora sp. SA101]|nr:12617_t:CDS:2 [Entrophospora sp. SA101]CAJ0845312.1 568_t:CDS:2 [Entrophospora sp. SA101]CAJ0871710.1 8103_t:CDS:2 [Entrophospora sp. SA101]CAJ0884538.1 5744_t:CDS:2 [Entrophospora sp. SA101]